MSGRIPPHFIDELVARTDIVELIGSRLPLKKAGREFRACCPFHDEKTPSFWVSPDKQFYHCFGCGAHGTAVGFLMNYDRLSFPEAVEELANRAGLDVPREADGRPADVTPSLSPLLDQVALYWHGALQRDPRAARYVRERGLEAATLKQFNIGFATNSWSDVLDRFSKDTKSREALITTGLVIEREGEGNRGTERLYDRFRDRIMFPIRDARGRTLGFGGRVIDQGEPKYLNSPETPLFQKGRELYGLYEARQSRQPLNRLLFVEGYMDVVRLHQAGLYYAVATLGTATTPEHLKRAFRLVSEVVFAFDGDRAGRAAAWRALNNALPEAKQGRQLRFLFLPDGEDPDSLVGKEGREAFEQRVAAAMPLSEYLIQELSAQADLSHADGKARLAELAKPLLARVPAGVYRELLLARVAQSIGLSADKLAGIWADDTTNQNRARSRSQGPDRPHHSRGVGRSAGRGGLLRQAVLTLLHHPKVVGEISFIQLEALDALDQPGIDILRSLLNELREDPVEHTAQVLERWRERPEYERLVRLATEESLIHEPASALRELSTALQRLVSEHRLRRFDELVAKSEAAELSAVEKLELRELMASRTNQSGP
jgi:DNA primase